MEICLRYLADPGFQNGVGEVVGVSQATVSKTVKFVVESICHKANIWITFSASTQEVNSAAQDWQATKRFPFCFGAVDGTLIPVQVPPRRFQPNEYYSGRKKFHCMNIQVTCDVNGEITSVTAKWPGSVHDARIWRNSAVNTLLSTGIAGNKLLIGDSAYPISTYLCKPYPQSEANTKSSKKEL